MQCHNIQATHTLNVALIKLKKKERVNTNIMNK